MNQTRLLKASDLSLVSAIPNGVVNILADTQSMCQPKFGQHVHKQCQSILGQPTDLNTVHKIPRLDWNGTVLT